MKKITILSGAGSVIPWDAPTTADITNSLISDHEFTTLSGKPVGEYIYDLLCSYYYRNKSIINFENIVNVIEDLYNYCHSQHYHGRIDISPTLSMLFDIKKDIIDDLLSLSSIYKFDGLVYSSNKNNKIFLPVDLYNYSYFEAIYEYFISIIMKHVERYSCLSNRTKACYNGINSFLNGFFNHFTDYSIRYYTLNYDELNKCLCPDKDIFNGFDLNDSDAHGPYSEPNYERIIYDDKSNCHYNLHGSFHLDYIPTNKKDLSWVYRPDVNNKSDGKSGDDYTQKGEVLLKTPIITGFNKITRLLLSPLYEMYQRFYFDCINSDIIICIGYSYSDYHINKSISNGIKNAKTIFYDLNYIDESKYHIKVNGRHAPHLNQLKGRLRMQSGEFEWEADGWMKFNTNDHIKMYYKGFELFLINNDWSYISL